MGENTQPVGVGPVVKEAVEEEGNDMTVELQVEGGHKIPVVEGVAGSYILQDQVVTKTGQVGEETFVDATGVGDDLGDFPSQFELLLEVTD